LLLDFIMLSKLFEKAKRLGPTSWGSIGVGLFPQANSLFSWTWHWYEHKETAAAIFKDAGGEYPMLIAIAEQWWFSLALIVIGLVYGIFVENSDHVKKHPWIPYIATVSVICAAIIMIAYTSITAFIAMPANENINQYYADQHKQRHLTSLQKDLISSECSKRPISGGPLYIYAYPDNESIRYLGELISSFKKCWVTTQYLGTGAQDPGEKGVMIYVIDPTKPSQDALRFMEIADMAHLPYTKTKWENRDGWPPSPDFMIFVAKENEVGN
jgi:hypothetical protein